MKKYIGVIYKIINTKTKIFYVGGTKEFEKRRWRHLNDLRKNIHHNKKLQKDFNEYGEDVFIFKIVKHSSDVKTDEQNILDSINYDESYNISPYSTIGDMSDFIDGDKISETLKRKHKLGEIKLKSIFGEDNPNWRGGKKYFCKCGSEISKVNNTCLSCRDISGSNNPFFGKKHSNETKEKLRKIVNEKYEKGSYKMPSNTQIVIIDSIEYKSKSYAARKLGCTVSTISNRIKSKKFKNYKLK